MSRITHKELLAITTKQAGLVVRDDGGLFGRVRVKADSTLTIPFYYRYRHGDKLHDISYGAWPHDSLAQIREARDAAHARAATGADPATVKKVQKIEVQEVLEAKLAQVEAQRERTGATIRGFEGDGAFRDSVTMTSAAGLAKALSALSGPIGRISPGGTLLFSAALTAIATPRALSRHNGRDFGGV